MSKLIALQHVMFIKLNCINSNIYIKIVNKSFPYQVMLIGIYVDLLVA